MRIRKYTKQDCLETMQLFYDTVHHINIKDYTKEQTDAWAPVSRDKESWHVSFINHYSLVIEEDGKILAFGDIDDSGYLDRFYVHYLYNGQGIGKVLLENLEKHIPCGKITTHASITAQPFFEHFGYRTIKRQTVECRSVKMDNYIMEKEI